MRTMKGVPKTGHTYRGARRPGAYTGPNWRGVGRVEVGADLGSGIGPGTTLLVNFDRHRVVAGGHYLVTVGGRPELVQFRRFPRGLCARVGGQWAAVSGADLGGAEVIGHVVKISRAAV